MKQSSRIWIRVWIAAAALGAAVTVYALAVGNEMLVAVGLPVAFLSALFIPAAVKRARMRRKLWEGADFLADWEYSPDEAERIAGEYKRGALKKNRGIIIFISVCLALLLLPFAFIAPHGLGLPAALALAAFLSLLLPWICAWVSSRLVARAILRQPCRSVIGRNCILVANRYHGLNDYSRLSAEGMKFLPASSGMAMLSVRYSYFAGKYRLSRLSKDVLFPVPLGREREAEELARSFKHLSPTRPPS